MLAQVQFFVQQITTRRKILYTTILMLALLLLAEGGLRARAWMRYGSVSASVRDPMLHYDPQSELFVPNPGYAVKGARIDIRINSLGFRGDEFTRVKPANTIRIAVLGASTTFNAEVSSNRATWPARLQEKLTAAYPQVNIQVINAAVGGYVAGDNLKNLRGRVLPLDPDLVIYYEANNEIVRDTRELAQRNGMADDRFRVSPIGRLARVSLLVDLVQKNGTIILRGRGGNDGAKTMNRIPRELPGRFLGVLDSMRLELDQRRIPMMLSTFVVKYRRDQDRATQVANADVAFYYMPWMSIDGLLDAMDVYNGAILTYGAQHRIPVVDDRNVIPPDAEHFTDCMHLADRGADVMAERFFRHLRSNGLMDQMLSKGPAAARPVQAAGAVR